MRHDDTEKRAFGSSISLILCSFLIVSAAQPDWSLICCLLTASIGYALFWKGNFYWQRRWQRFLCAALWFAAVQAFHLSWLTSTRYIGPFILAGYAFILCVKGVQFGALSLLVASSRRILAVAGAWVLMEWSCLLFIFSGYAFDPIGLALSASPATLQLASLFGVLGLSFWVVMTNLCIVHKKKVWGVIALLLPFLYGGLQTVYHKQAMEEERAVLLVQAAIPPELRYQINPEVQALSPLDQWRYLLDLLAPYQNEAVDLIVFPESAVRGALSAPYYEKRHVDHILTTYFPSVHLPHTVEPFVSNAYWTQALADTFGAAVVIGLESERYNVACYFEPYGEAIDLYRKQQLVPFGEYIPMRQLLNRWPFNRWMSDAYSVSNLDQLALFEAGREGSLLGGKIGASVCYEELNGGLMLKSRRKGAQLHVNISNDGWFPRSRLPIAHFFHGKIRSVEQGIPQLRACNIGVTCGIDSLGRVIAQLPHETKRMRATPGVLKLALPVHTYRTLYSYTGNALVVCLSALFVLFALLRKKRG